MPRKKTTTKKKVTKPVQKEAIINIEDLTDLVSKMVKTVTGISKTSRKVVGIVQKLMDRMEKLEGGSKYPTEKLSDDVYPQFTFPSTTTTTTTTPQLQEQKYPIPQEYREIIDTILNRGFGLKVEPLTDQPAFDLTIVVPDKYSSLTPEEKQISRVDLRSKIINYAEGSNGVRAWAERVYKNFNPEIQAQIVADRVQLK